MTGKPWELPYEEVPDGPIPLHLTLCRRIEWRYLDNTNPTENT